MKVNKENLDKLKIWWNLAYEDNNTEIFDKCNDLFYNTVGEYLEVNRFKKYSRAWKDLKMNDLAYLPELPLNSNGILQYYYTKDDIVRLCDENKVVGCYVWKNIKGERVEDYFKELKSKYYEWFLKDKNANIFKSEVSSNIFKLLTREERCDILNVLDEETGKRKQ